MIKIEITDVGNEHPENLRALGNALIHMANAGTNSSVLGLIEQAEPDLSHTNVEYETLMVGHTEVKNTNFTEEEIKENVKPETNAAEIFGKKQVEIEKAYPQPELDSEGKPWDARIHTEKKTKIVNGTWKLKRGIDADLVDKVKNNISISSHIPPIPSPPVIPPIPAIMTTVNTTEEIPLSFGFPQLIKKITGYQGAGRLTKLQTIQILNSLGIQSLPLLAARLDMIPAVSAAIDALVLA